MHKKTVRSGLRLIAAGMVFVLVATFFHDQLSRLLFLDMVNQGRVTFLGFFLGGISAGCGVLVSAVGLLRSGGDEPQVVLTPTFVFLFSLVLLFFVLAYKTVPAQLRPMLPPGESVNI